MIFSIFIQELPYSHRLHGSCCLFKEVNFNGIRYKWRQLYRIKIKGIVILSDSVSLGSLHAVWHLKSLLMLSQGYLGKTPIINNFMSTTILSHRQNWMSSDHNFACNTFWAKCFLMVEIHSSLSYCPVQSEKVTRFPSVLLWMCYLKPWLALCWNVGLSTPWNVRFANELRHKG